LGNVEAAMCTFISKQTNVTAGMDGCLLKQVIAKTTISAAEFDI
jgi:hypothetical protein